MDYENKFCFILLLPTVNKLLLLFRSKQLIKDAILDNDFLKKLDSNQVKEIVDCMYVKNVTKSHYIIKEGEAGQFFYVLAGKFIRDRSQLSTFSQANKPYTRGEGGG